MLGLAPKDMWLAGLLLVSATAFAASARWPARLVHDRTLVAWSVGFSLAFAFLALTSGLALLQE